jgi:hypothetical protein
MSLSQELDYIRTKQAEVEGNLCTIVASLRNIDATKYNWNKALAEALALQGHVHLLHIEACPDSKLGIPDCKERLRILLEECLTELKKE